MEELSKKPVFSADEIQNRIKELGAIISADYADKPLVVVCVLKGAFMFFSDLVKEISIMPEVDFVRVASYGSGNESSRTISFTKDIELSVKDKHVILVDDIVDSGYTMAFLLRQFEARGAASIRISALVDKEERRETPITVDYPGFTLPSGFIVGYGLDYSERYRNLRAVHELHFA